MRRLPWEWIMPVTTMLSGCLLLSEPPLLEGGAGRPAPADGWVDVAARAFLVCAIHSDGSLWCGDSSLTLRLNAVGPFVAISQGSVGSLCGVYEDGRLFCADGLGDGFELEGPYINVAGGEDAGCGLFEDGSVTCWPEDDALPGPFSAIGAGDDFACGVRQSSAGLRCWSIDDLVFDEPLANVPAGAFRQVAISNDVGCAVTTTQSVTCWGYDFYDLLPGPPAGSYSRVALADATGCAITAGGSVECWGEDSTVIENQIPQDDIQYLQIDLASDGSGCGIDSESVLHCW